MSLGKLLLVSPAPPCSQFLALVNRSLREPATAHQYAVSHKDFGGLTILPESRCRITRGAASVRPFSLTLNFGINGCTLLEMNPAAYLRGYSDLHQVIEDIFGKNHPDFRISRIDLFADVTFPVDTLHRTLRVPYKRKASQFTRTDADRGIMGLYFGRSPSQLRVYDKKAEMRRKRRETAGLPKTFTRVEWEYRRNKCPVHRFSRLTELLDFKPFESLEFIESEEIYDFHQDRKKSSKLFLFNKLKEDYGLSEAYRILNQDRNFRRDFRDLTKGLPDIKSRIHQSFEDGIQNFFENRLSDLTLARRASGQEEIKDGNS